MEVTAVVAPRRTDADVVRPILEGWGSGLRQVPCDGACVLIDLRKVLSRTWDVRFIHASQTKQEVTALRVFSPKTLQASGSCPVCRLMVRSLNGDSSNIISGLERCELDTGESAQGKALKLVGFRPVLRESFQSRSESLIGRVLRGKLYGDMLVDDAPSRLFILPLGDDAHLLGNKPNNYARTLQPDYASLDRIREWLRRCEMRHTACRLSKQRLTAEQRPARLIDVIDICIDQDVKWPARYFALSYVWGTVNNRDTTKYFAAATRGSRIPLNVDLLPRVIQDAIKLTRDVGERFLWVDALCINQVDLVEKAAEIAKMNHVYSGAVMTIVALGSSHANTGLHGVSAYNPPRKTEVEAIDGIRLTTVLPRVQEILSWPSCSWANRAWTMQEHLLSNRLLVMGPQQAYFLCRQTAYSEDRYENETTMFPKSLQQRRSADSPGFWDEWTADVSVYSARAITVLVDRYQAIQGYMNEIETTRNVEFAQGLPVKHLPRALYWLHELSSSHGVPVSRTRIEPYPSWCWTGWTGQVRYPKLIAFHCFVSACTVVHNGQSRSFGYNSYGLTSGAPSTLSRFQSSDGGRLSAESQTEHKSHHGDSSLSDTIRAEASATLVLQAPVMVLTPSIYKNGMFGIKHTADGPYVGVLFCEDSLTNHNSSSDKCTCLVLGTSWRRSKRSPRWRNNQLDDFPATYLDSIVPPSDDNGTFFRRFSAHNISMLMTYFACRDRLIGFRNRSLKQLYHRLLGDNPITPVSVRIVCIISLGLVTPIVIAVCAVEIVFESIAYIILAIIWALGLGTVVLLGPPFTMLLNLRVARRPSSRVDNALITTHYYNKVAHFLWIEDTGNGHYIRRGVGELHMSAYKQRKAEVKAVKLI